MRDLEQANKNAIVEEPKTVSDIEKVEHFGWKTSSLIKKTEFNMKQNLFFL